MEKDWKLFKPFTPPEPLTEAQLEPYKKDFEGWAGSLDNDKPPSKDQVQKLFTDGVQKGREVGFEEGYAKGAKIATEHFTAARYRTMHRHNVKNADGFVTVHTTNIEDSERTNKTLISVELNEVMAAYAVLPNEVKINAIFDLLESKFGVKIDRNKDGR